MLPQRVSLAESVCSSDVHALAIYVKMILKEILQYFRAILTIIFNKPTEYEVISPCSSFHVNRFVS
ncbi:hypothetical protein DPMN_191207 [Dreissena polymorpha]|uniref:Uncharacterized protein n=1 Tax=Dreissena polymorpha TaxID=45954 RepID=A0A9D4BDN7_DREPO|nr:hypothetical protein DPMN_191207 [Dreissena polymorpha]